jgi:3-methylcrotonyl-CoA carboxylase alpha subunit
VVALTLPDSVRVDSGIEAGGTVSPYYDPMIAKLIAHAPTRAAALERLAEALDRTLVAGTRSNVAFLAALCRAAEFRAGKVDTGFIERNLAALGAVPQPLDPAAVARGVAHLLAHAGEHDEEEADSPWAARDGFQLGGTRAALCPVVAEGENLNATLQYGADGLQVLVAGVAPATDATVFQGEGGVFVLRHGRQTRVRLRDFATDAREADASSGLVTAPMHGRVLELLVSPGDRVAKGERLATIEAMKMEHTLTAPCDGIVGEIAVGAANQVVEGAKIMMIEPRPDKLK